MKVTFKFELDQVVKTILGNKGVIGMLGVDDGGVSYFVKGEKNSDWFKEAQLESTK
jgi:hypothetical protein